MNLQFRVCVYTPRVLTQLHYAPIFRLPALLERLASGVAAWSGLPGLTSDGVLLRLGGDIALDGVERLVVLIPVVDTSHDDHFPSGWVGGFGRR